MVVATADGAGRPNARTVLLKGYDERGLVFFTNHTSRKGREIAENPHASAVFPWFAMRRQPLVFTGMFAYIFGGAVSGDVQSYLPLIIPGLIGQTVLTACVATTPTPARAWAQRAATSRACGRWRSRRCSTPPCGFPCR